MGSAAVEHVGVVGRGSGCERADAGAHQAERGAVDFLRQHLAGDGEDLCRQLRRRVNRLRAGALPEIGGLQFQCDGQAREIAALEARGNLLRQPPQRSFQRGKIADIGLERGLVGNGLGAAIGHHGAIVDAARQPPQPAALAGELFHQIDFVGALEIGDDTKAALRQPFLGRRSDAENESDRSVGQHGAGLLLVERSKTARLVHVGGDLGQEFVAGKADGDRDADVAFDLLGEARQHFRRDHAVHALGAGEIQKRFVDRKRLDQRRQRLHRVAHLAPDSDIFRHVGPDHGGMRA